MIGFCSLNSFAQLKVKGTVQDVNDQSTLPGVSVLVKGTTVGTASDINGGYALEIPSKSATLVFSFIGYETQEIYLNNSSELNISLKPAVNQLNELVVVGYSTQKKKDLTGAVSVVNVKSIGNSPYSNVVQAMQGKISGVTITQDGQPGTGRSQIKVRGLTTFNNNTPLYVIDGIPSSENLNNLNPNDIESIQVLKDAASASIYGSRSAGGVIIITTKKGTKGKLTVDAGVQTGIQTLGNKIDLLDAQQWGEVYWTAAKNAGLTPKLKYLYGEGATPVISTTPFIIPNQKQIYQYSANGTNWYKEIYQTAKTNQYFVNFSNGNEKGSVFMGFSYFTQDGLIKYTNFDRYTARVNSDYKILDWIKVGENLSISASKEVQIGSQQGQDGIPLDVIRQHPLLPVFDVKGNYAGKISGFPDVRNMVSVLEKNKDNTTKGKRIFGNTFLEANFLDAFKSLKKHHDLLFRSNFGIEYSDYYDRRFEAAYHEGDYDISGNALTNNYGNGTTLTYTNTLEYGYTSDKHNLKILGGTETIQYKFNFLSGRRNDFEIEDPYFTWLSAGSGSQTNSGGGTEWALLSYFGRADYSFADKYLLSGTIRYDKTSRLKTSGTFPAISAGWRISNESFFENLLTTLHAKKSITDLKLRAGYGEQGNQNIGDFATLSVIGADINHGDYDLEGTNSQALQGYIVLSRGNPNLRWETTRQYNFGADLSLFEDRFVISADYYIKNTEDVLRQLGQISAVGEGSAPWINAAKIQNKGIDLNATYNYYNSKKDFRFSTTFQFDKYRNEVISLGADSSVAQIGYEKELYMEGFDGPTRIVVGKPFSEFYGYKVEGIFQSQQDIDNHATQLGAGIGRLMYEDINHDSIVNERDRTYLGSPHPKFSAGLNLNAEYKGFSMTAFFYSSVGQKIYNEIKWYTDFAQCGNFNHSANILDAWSTDNTGSTIPSPTLDNANQENRASTYYIEDGSYFKMRSLRIGYHIPEKFTRRFKVNVYAEMQNIFTITNYSGIDPEVPYAGNVNVAGIDRGVYPLPKTYMFGININM
jgi:TonB-dependent starch-binding outer membrane protein SusC